MHTIKITDSDGLTVEGHAPASWEHVTLPEYAALAAATDWPGRAQALAAITGLPAEPLLDDVSLCVGILRAAPFLIEGPLPAVVEDAPAQFRHQGVTYVPTAANLEKITGAQMEGLTAFLEAAEGNALAAAPNLLAILYKPKNAKLTADVVRASAAAFATLPMATAYPLLLNFWKRSESLALPIQRYLAVRPMVVQMRNALEVTLRASASVGASWNLRRWLIQTWLRLVSRSLRSF